MLFVVHCIAVRYYIPAGTFFEQLGRDVVPKDSSSPVGKKIIYNFLLFPFLGTTESVRLTPQMKDFIAYRTSGKWKQLARVLSSDNDIDIIIEQIEHDCRKSMYDQSYKMISKLIERRSHVEWEFFKNGLMKIKADGIVDDFEKQFITNSRGTYFFSIASFVIIIELPLHEIHNDAQV